MFNMIRMDLYRIFKSKGLYVVLGIGILGAVITQAMFYILSNPEIYNVLQSSGTTLTGSEDIMDVTGISSTLEFIDKSIFGGGLYPVMLAILTSIFVGSDFKSGYIKNILAYRNRRYTYIISKLVTMTIAGLFLSLLLFLTLLGLTAIIPIGYSPSSFADITWYYLTLQILNMGYIGMILLVMMLTRSESAGIGVSIVVVGGIFTMLLENFLQLLGRSMAPFSLVFKHMQIPMVFEPPVNINYWLTGFIYCAIYTILATLLLYKKDVA